MESHKFESNHETWKNSYVIFLPQAFSDVEDFRKRAHSFEMDLFKFMQSRI